MKHIIWVVQHKTDVGYVPCRAYTNRRDARYAADYFNGFSKGKKTATYRVRKYVEATQ